MSLYNAIFGTNQYAGILLAVLGTAPDEIPRFRDAFIDEDDRITIYTRTGGGNRAYYESEDACRGSYPEYFDDEDCAPPSGPWNSDLRDIPGFLYDEDDDFDSTYASFYYQKPDGFDEVLAMIKESQTTKNPREAFKRLLADLEKGGDTPEAGKALAVGEKIMRAISEPVKEQ